MDCSSFVAANASRLSSSKTRGAYNVLVHLATALSSDTGANTVEYFLMTEDDLALDPVLQQGVSDARARVMAAVR